MDLVNMFLVLCSVLGMVYLVSSIYKMFILTICTAYTQYFRPLIPFDRALRPVYGGFQVWGELGIFHSFFLAFLSVSMVFTTFLVFTLTLALCLGMLVMFFFGLATL